MQAHNNLILLIASLLTAQVSSDSRALIDDATTLLAEFKEITHGSYDSAILKLNGHYSDYVIVLNTLKTLGTAQIDQEYQYFSLNLDDIKKSAETSGLDISSCLETREDRFNQLHALVQQYMDSCIITRGYQVENILWRGVNSVNQTLDRATEVEAEFEKCRVVENNDLCLAEIIGVIGKETQELPATIIRIVDTVMQYLDFSMVSFGSCATEQLNTLDRDASAIIAEIQQCIDNLS